VPKSVRVRPEITSDEQVLAALLSTGAGFEAAGGSAQMLTEAVENGVDSIIEARRLGIPTSGKIRVIVDQVNRSIEVHDNGMGFKDPVHIARKPFESLKRYDPELTGKFARGIQGFRSFCEKLTILTKRPSVPAGEDLQADGESGLTIRLGFEARAIEVELTVVEDAEWNRRTQFPSGAIVIYSDWKKGEFDRFREDLLVTRLQHHFGELVRGGEFEIEAEDGSSLSTITPIDYSSFSRITIAPVDVKDPSGSHVIGQVVPELYLMDRLRRDRWLYPYLLFHDRPVGDRAICQIEEFDDAGAWESPYITGFVRCDFCEINELRQALKPGHERAALYSELQRLEESLNKVLLQHHKTIFEARMQAQINDLVVELQDFLKRENVFKFKIARAPGSLTSEEKAVEVPLSGFPGSSDSTGFVSANGGDPAIIVENASVSPTTINPNPDGTGDAMTHQSEFGGVGSGGAVQKGGGPSMSGSGDVAIGGEPGYRDGEDSLLKAREADGTVANGDEGPQAGRRRARRRRPRGFGIKQHNDEFNDDLSWFEPTTSYIIINSGHERYKAREPVGEEAAKLRGLMDYLAELYIWEISKLAGVDAGKSVEDISNQFLQVKFKFFDQRKEG
jgi:hypothetical protein